jgi:hypothetical protein
MGTNEKDGPSTSVSRSVAIVAEQEAPPAYQSEGNPPGVEEHTVQAPPEYDESHPPPPHPDQRAGGGLFPEDTSRLPPIPYTALYLLGQDTWDTKDKARATSDATIDPGMFEFELACLFCLEYKSQCSCPTKRPRSRVESWELPRARKSIRSSIFPAKLVEEIGEKSAHLSSAVANSLWPAIYRGMIPVVNDQCLVVLRSRALDRESDPKALLKRFRNPIDKIAPQNCDCGCRRLVCEKIAKRHGLQGKALEATTAMTYTTRGQSFNAARLTNGVTCYDMRELGLLDVDTADEDDFLLYYSLLPTLGMPGTRRPPPQLPKDPKTLPWDLLLSSLLHEVLTCQDLQASRFESPPLRSICKQQGRTHAVLRAENFGTGPGYIVTEVLGRGGDSSRSVSSSECLSYVANMNGPRGVPKDGFMSDSSSSQPRPGTLLDSKPDKAWGSVSFETKFAEYPQLKKGMGLFAKKTRVGLSSRPLPGARCDKTCSEGPGDAITAYSAGFAPPDPNSDQSHVYSLERDPLPWLVVAQYAFKRPQPLFYVSHLECTRCTVLRAPKGSIIATGLPPTMLLSGMILT